MSRDASTEVPVTRSSPASRGRAGLFRRLFATTSPDVLGLLAAQGELSVRAATAFARWSAGDADAAAEVRRLEHEADDARRALLEALRRALATPIDREDLYILSERCDRVVNASKDVVQLAIAVGFVPDRHCAEMARHLEVAARQLVRGFGALRHAPDEAGAAADQAVRAAHAVTRCYRRALAELLHSPAGAPQLASRELYRSYARIADLAIAVADRLWYAVLAEL